MASGKRTDLFVVLQSTHNIGVVVGKIWKLVLDGGIRWNSSYAMIRRALKLKDPLNVYCTQLKISINFDNKEVYEKDYFNPTE
jgi:hypothetical protein